MVRITWHYIQHKYAWLYMFINYQIIYFNLSIQSVFYLYWLFFYLMMMMIIVIIINNVIYFGIKTFTLRCSVWMCYMLILIPLNINELSGLKCNCRLSVKSPSLWLQELNFLYWVTCSDLCIYCMKDLSLHWSTYIPLIYLSHCKAQPSRSEKCSHCFTNTLVDYYWLSVAGLWSQRTRMQVRPNAHVKLVCVVKQGLW